MRGTIFSTERSIPNGMALTPPTLRRRRPHPRPVPSPSCRRRRRPAAVAVPPSFRAQRGTSHPASGRVGALRGETHAVRLYMRTPAGMTDEGALFAGHLRFFIPQK
ncbi:MAG: hypothetical protein LBB79_00920 [Prevotellaceae bacterium]|nr:hypothetical protein [Prevotellaceae bacterium]